jgi:hypothetical protein
MEVVDVSFSGVHFVEFYYRIFWKYYNHCHYHAYLEFGGVIVVSEQPSNTM